MPKRAVTPPPADDEPRYLTVIHPYPLHAHMELQKDREDFGRWLACCIGPDPFYAFFHKPSSLNMVIIEVKRQFDGFDRLLGEHRWNEFLKNPSEEEMEKVTQVFYCVYNSGRQVQKHGWKRIDSQESWFRNWSQKNDLIKYPYPETHYCERPLEDQTNQPLCRPLPNARFSPPPAITQAAGRPPPPGSEGWVSQKACNTAAPTREARRTGTPTSLHMPASSRGGKASASAKANWSPAKTGKNGGSSPWTRGLSSLTFTSSGSSTGFPNSWNCGPPSSTSFVAAGSATSPVRSQSGMAPCRDASCASSPSVPTLLSTLPPPGLDRVAASLSWADDIPPGLFPDTIVNDAQSTLPHIDDFAPAFSIATTHPDVPDNIEEAFAELQTTDPLLGYASKWEYTDNQQVKIPELPAAGSGSLWGDYEAEQFVEQELICKDHGRICKKGICKTYAKQLRDGEKAKKMAEKMEEKPNRGRGRGRGKGRDGGGVARDSNNWRSRAQNRGQENYGPPAESSNSNHNSSGTSTPPNASSADDDDEECSVIGSPKDSNPSRRRADSIKSAAPSVASGWGAFDSGPW